MTMTPEERLEEIYNTVSDEIASGRDMLVSTRRLLQRVIELATGEDNKQSESVQEDTSNKIVISCDASIKVNPGGQAAIGAVIRIPGEPKLVISKHTSATTNNEAEYDAIYEGMVALVNLHNRLRYPVTIRSDSQLVVKQLSGEYQINNDTLKRKCQSIHELAAAMKVPVAIEWKPRNSTPDLTEANFTAQDAIGAKRH